jgi:2-polyprenyl-3-methyl-5-hydroxy-6-metoxy-1,4-benzoquinol methylase
MVDATPLTAAASEWRMEEQDCPLCGESRASSIPLGRRGGTAHRAGLGVETGVVRCRRCHGVYQRPTAIPVRNPYDAHEPDGYFAAHDASSKIEAGEYLAGRAEDLLGRKGSMLEIGCGRGELLRGAANRGWRVAGVDMTEGFARAASSRYGVEVEIASAERAASLQRVWDVVVLAAVLEHVYDPLALLDRVKRSLCPRGLVYIDVPNECSLFSRMGNLYQRLRGRDWAVNLSPTFSPFHVVGFCPKSLRLALAASGLEVAVLELYDPQPCVATPGQGLAGRLEDLGARVGWALGRRLGMAGGIMCWARGPA